MESFGAEPIGSTGADRNEEDGTGPQGTGSQWQQWNRGQPSRLVVKGTIVERQQRIEMARTRSDGHCRAWTAWEWMGSIGQDYNGQAGMGIGEQGTGSTGMERPGASGTAQEGRRSAEIGRVWFFYFGDGDMAIYEWGEQLNMIVRTDHLEAQTAGEELERIKKKYGGKFSTKHVVNESRPKRAKYHKCFEWNDSIAGERFRQEQAGALVRSIKVVYQNAEGEMSNVRAFSSVRDPTSPRHSVYVETVSALGKEDTRFEILEQAYNGLVSWRRRWTELNECSDSVATVDKAIAQIRRKIEKWKVE